MSKRRKIAVFATEPVTGKIGGLGIRQLQVARTLAKNFSVRLFTAYRVDAHKEPFEISQIDYEQPHTLEEPIRWADTVYSGQPAVAPLTKKYNKPVAVDLLVHEYCEDLEFLPLEKMDSLEQSVYFSDCITRLSRQLDMGDFFLCSNERERDFYLGILTLFGRLVPGEYPKDPQFRSLIDVAPFGIPKREPKKGKNILRGKVSGIGPKDFLIVWGGTLANWFDSLTPIRAMARLKKKCPKAKLVFVGNKHPVPAEAPQAFRNTVKLAKRMGVYEKNVFFYSDWVPYELHEYYLAEANAGMVAFHNHLENHFSFRIRVVDYLWGNLPVLTNPGNVLSNLIEQNNMGRVFPFGDDKTLAESIEWMVTHRTGYRKMLEAVSREKKQFHWEKALAPLIRFCKSPKKTSTLFNNGNLYDLENLKNKNTFTADQMLHLVPSHPYMRLMLARKNMQENKPQKAASLMADHLRLFGHGLENKLFRLPLFDVPVDFTYEEMLHLVPSHPHASLMKTKKKLNENKLKEAESLIDAEIELFGETPEALFCRGLLYQHLGQHRKAVKDFENVNAAQPARIECRLPLADSLVALKETEKAQRLYQEAWKRAEGKAEEWVRARAARALAKLNAGPRTEAETLGQYQKRDPDNESLSYAYASALENAGRQEEARFLFESFTVNFTNKPLRAAAWFRLARLSPNPQRKKMLQTCLQLDPRHSGAQGLLQIQPKKPG